MAREDGMISLKNRDSYFTLYFPEHGWLATELLQFIDDVMTATDQNAAILKLLGYTLQFSTDSPPRKTQYWAIVDLGARVLETNSEMVRRAVDREPPEPGSPHSPMALKKLHAVLDRFDFTVKLYR